MAERVQWKWFAASTIVALLATAAIAQAVLNASAVDNSMARKILDDPSAVHSRILWLDEPVKRPG